MKPVEPEVKVYQDLNDLSNAAADLVLDDALSSIEARGRFILALSGGFTPKQLFSLFAADPWRKKLPWSKTHLFWVDERCVPPDHSESNYRLARDAFLDYLSLLPKQVHRICGEDGPDKAASAYEKELESFFKGALPRFDAELLGMGENGHTASLCPGASTLRERKRWVLPVHLEPPRISRVTLTLPVLCNARDIIFLASGRSKATALHEIIEDGNPQGYPAGLVQPENGKLTWMVDRDAASLIGKGIAQGGPQRKGYALKERGRNLDG
jgi:6-phosphogluconolactonase